MKNIFLFFLFVGVPYPSTAEPMPAHKARVQELVRKTDEYEKRILELQERKKKATEGDELEEVLSEIADIHKELLLVRQKKNQLKEHLRNDHPEEDRLAEIGLFRQPLKAQGKKAANDPLEKKLDDVLALMQKQYARTLGDSLKYRDEMDQASKEKADAGVVVDKKEKYLKEKVKTDLKVK